MKTDENIVKTIMVCRGIIHERRRPILADQKRSINGAQRGLKNQGRASAPAKPIVVSEMPLSRRRTGKAVA
ncbi:MAG: hypothetical protein BWX55_00697 [Deltaproteobacteria bacterium ADurb.Bin022]|nr:MAG: hypothetical protein BWX55_00697 [Deltaproteobacteria bacterium ADurb.Bin022]